MPTSFTLSAILVEEIFQTLIKLPYGSVVQTIAKLQAEVAQQQNPAPTFVGTQPEPPIGQSATISDIAAKAGARRKGD